MALKEWQINFNTAKTLESEGADNELVILEYKLMLKNLGNEVLNPSEANAWNEACRNLIELYCLDGMMSEAEFFQTLIKEEGQPTSKESFERLCQMI